jgi:putative membrane protein
MRNQLATTALLIAATGVLCAPPASAAPVGDQDASFVRTGHRVDLAEIAAGEDARKNATTACVKAVGAALVRDHTQLDAGLVGLAKELAVSLPDSPAPEDRRKLEAVRAKAGTAAYDTAWLADQAAGHTRALALIDEEIAQGDNAQVVAAARVARPVIAMHLDMVRGGTCNGVAEPKTIDAGSGGHLAAVVDDHLVLGTVALTGGAVLAGAGLWLLAARRRDNAGR